MLIAKEKKEAALSENNNSELKKCFIITPIGDENTEIRRQIDGIIDECIKPILIDFEIFVSHRICLTGSINNQILSHIYNDDLVIANLTNLNPNVMYELAFRHAIRKPVIVIKNKNDGFQLPFDVKEDRTIFYTNDISGTGELKRELAKFLKEIDFTKDADNHISRAIADVKIRDYIYNNDDFTEVKQEGLGYIINRLDKIEEKLNNVKVNQEILKVVNSNYKVDYSYYLSKLEIIQKRLNACSKKYEFEELLKAVDLLHSEFEKSKFAYSGKDKEEFYFNIDVIKEILNAKIVNNDL